MLNTAEQRINRAHFHYWIGSGSYAGLHKKLLSHQQKKPRLFEISRDPSYAVPPRVIIYTHLPFINLVVFSFFEFIYQKNAWSVNIKLFFSKAGISLYSFTLKNINSILNLIMKEINSYSALKWNFPVKLGSNFKLKKQHKTVSRKNDYFQPKKP